MRRVLIFLCILFVPVSFGFASNMQKIYSVDSPVAEAITNLYISKGYAHPSTSGPWSAGELLHMVNRIDPASLNSAEEHIYTYILEELEDHNDQNELFQFSLQLALEGYYHIDTDNFVTDSDWIRGFNDRKPLANLVLETWPGEHFYGYSELSIAGRRITKFIAQEGPGSFYYGEKAFTSSLFFLPPAGIDDLDLGMPYRAFGAFGGDGWSVQIGRDKLSWGPGVTGNFLLSNHLKYHDTGRIALYGKNFKYTLATSFFAHPYQYYPVVDEAGNYVNEYRQDQVMQGLHMFLGHRLEWRLFGGKVGFALSEAIMYQTASEDSNEGLILMDTVLDLRILNPSMIYHNLYIRSNANSLITLEFDYTPIKHLNLYGQVAIDEFALPGEHVPGVDEQALPSAYGYMAGAKVSYPVQKGFLYGSFEWVHTDPYLYLRDVGKGGRDSQHFGEYGVNWVVAHREYSNRLVYIEDFIGYPQGPDAIVLNGNVGYKAFGKWYVEGNLFYMLHGTHDAWTLWSFVYNENASWAEEKPPYLQTPTEKHWTGNNADIDARTRDAVSETTVFGITGGYSMLSNLEIYAQADFITIKNPGNRSINGTVSDVQISFGFSYSL